MKLDKLDFKTLDALHQGGPEQSHTTSDIAKKVFDDHQGRLSNLDTRIRSRLNKMANYGIVIKDESGPTNQFNVAYEDVVYGQTEMEVKDDLGDGSTVYNLQADKVLFISNPEGITIRGFIPLNGDNDLEKYVDQSTEADRLNDPEWLKKKYVDEEMSVSEIADELGVKPYYVSIWVNHFGLTRLEQK